ncbi:hypothetical protein N9425_02675 [Gammaproteobacteria bacterium]|nr:hypothetical protein [Gammaproteobacteria bacterium]
MSKAIILVAVRLKSSRLPMKALADLSGKPLIVRVTERLQKARIPENIIWCTSINKQDDPLEKIAKENNIKIFRGSELDVMSRFLEVARVESADTIVRVTGDNPLTDHLMIDFMLRKHLSERAEYTYTEELPIGTRPEIIDFDMLNNLHSQLQDPNSSEYMTLMLNRPDKFNILKLGSYDSKLNRPELRLTVDTRDDLQLFEELYNNLGEDFLLKDVISWLDNNPKKILLVSDIFTTIPASVNVKLIDD